MPLTWSVVRPAAVPARTISNRSPAASSARVGQAGWPGGRAVVELAARPQEPQALAAPERAHVDRRAQEPRDLDGEVRGYVRRRQRRVERSGDAQFARFFDGEDLGQDGAADGSFRELHVDAHAVVDGQRHGLRLAVGAVHDGQPVSGPKPARVVLARERGGDAGPRAGVQSGLAEQPVEGLSRLHDRRPGTLLQRPRGRVRAGRAGTGDRSGAGYRVRHRFRHLVRHRLRRRDGRGTDGRIVRCGARCPRRSTPGRGQVPRRDRRDGFVHRRRV